MLKQAFERVYVVNLTRREDRWKEFREAFPADWPFAEPLRYPAVDGGLVPRPDWWKDGDGAWGCYRTHLRIMEECMNDGVESVLFLEDDALCVEDFTLQAKAFWDHLPDDWGMVYLGGQHLEENIRLPRKVNDWVYRPYNINRTHCYGLRGRKMMSAVYRHLHDFASWKVPHHIDHYLGEFHKRTNTGIYVPRRWLVKQAAGNSDVCCKEVEDRLFHGAGDLVDPVVDLPGVAILGGYFGGTNTIAGAMFKMGLPLGTDVKETGDPKAPFFYEDHWLGVKCRNAYSEPWLIEQSMREDRVNQLRHWAGTQCRYKKDAATMFCGKHPILSLMGPELLEAWNRPKFICVDRNLDECAMTLHKVRWGWHPTAVTTALKRLREAREEFFTKYSPPLLRIPYENMRERPEETLDALCDFLEFVPEPESREDVIAWIGRSKDDRVSFQ